LADFSKTYSIDTVKGCFPHKMNIPENQNYIGPMPTIDMYGAKNMDPIKVYPKFIEWYDTVKNETFDFKLEFKKYCLADVELLAKAILKFRKIFKDKLDVDPWRYVTLASLRKDIYINKFIPEKTIVGNGGSKPISRECREWLLHLNDETLVPEVPLTVKSMSGDKYKELFGVDYPESNQCYRRPTHTFTVDALDYQGKHVKEFLGCYYHGCPKCHPDRQAKYVQNLERNKLLENAGYTVEEIWECDWQKIQRELPNKKELETKAKAQNINIRDALFGGRTEAFK